jgi:Cellulase (glycosyl hydrolase family 5)
VRRLLALLALAVLAAPPSAFAAHDAELSMMDDQALLGASQARVDSVLSRMQSFGADRLRVSAYWSQIAPAPTSTKEPARFDPSYPYAPEYRFGDLDRVVRSAVAHGMKVLISLSTPVPYWASDAPKRKNDVWMPDPKQFAAFAYAVAARYSAYADQFAILNEPNQGAWLQPQSLGGKPVAPHLYRALVRAGYPAIKMAAPKAMVLVGELAASGRDDPGVTRPIRPLAFLRTMGCRDARFHALRSGRCKGFKAVPLDALGHHPYALFQSPFQRSHYRDDAAIGDWRRLEQTIDRLVAVRSLKPPAGGRVPIYYTEFGYQTDPPDPFAGIPLARQSRWLQDAAYVAWSTPRVLGLNQFRVTDGGIRGSSPLAFREFQSGLFFANGKAKPSARTFADPIVVRPSGRSRLLVWGQARAGGAHDVEVDRGAKQIARVHTDSRGYFRIRVRRRAGSYRFRWADAAGSGRSDAVRVR